VLPAIIKLIYQGFIQWDWWTEVFGDAYTGNKYRLNQDPTIINVI
jgi:hypothetical protein